MTVTSYISEKSVKWMLFGYEGGLSESITVINGFGAEIEFVFNGLTFVSEQPIL